jgi:hypothetical protein
MAELIHRHSKVVRSGDGKRYRATSYGEQRRDGTWSGWIEFVPADGAQDAALRTDQETSQPDRQAVDYWAGGLEPIYLEGALNRARKRQERSGVGRGWESVEGKGRKADPSLRSG